MSSLAQAVHSVVEGLERRTLLAETALSGSIFGTNPSVSSQYELKNAYDGNVGTAFNYGLPSGGYVGIDLGDGNAEIVSKIRYYPVAGYEAKMVGGKFQGSNTGPNSGFTDLHTISTTPPRTWTDVTISSSTSYRWLRYLSPDNSYSRVSEIEFSTDNSSGAPAAPSALQAVETLPGNISLSWIDNATGETGYRVERRTGPAGTWATLATLDDDTTSYTDTSGRTDRIYSYRVRALNSAGDWVYSAEAAIATSQFSTKLGGTAFGVSPPNAAGNEFGKAHDGNVATAYTASVGTGAYTGIDLGAGVDPARISRIRFFPMNGFEYRMNGGKFQGSNTGPTSGFTDLATVDGVPARGWNEIYVDDTTEYRWLRYVGPTGGYSSVAEIEFYGQGASTFKANLSVADVPEADEETVGRYVRANENHDEGNIDPAGSPLADNEPHGLGGDGILEIDPDIVRAAVSLGSVAGTWSLTFPAEIKVWRKVGEDFVPVISGAATAHDGEAAAVELFIEGIAYSDAVNGTALALAFTPTGGGTPVTDQVNLTVTSIDLDIDSDNDNQFGNPEFDRREERLEQNRHEPGKRLYLNNNDSDGDGVVDWADGFNRDGVNGNADDLAANEQFVPLPVLVNRPINLSTATFRISYSASNPAVMSGTTPSAGHLRLWKKDGSDARSKNSAASGGDYVAPGDYTAAQLGIDAGGEATFWIEAIATTSTVSDRRIEIQVDPDGAGPLGFVAADSVFVTAEHVAALPGTITGFKWDDQNENAERDGNFLLSPPNTIFVIDVSGSTRDTFRGEDIGDVNGDSYPKTVLDGELAAFRELSRHIEGLEDPDARVSVVVFGNSAKILDLSAAPGLQNTIAPGAALEDILEGIQIGHEGVNQGTNYEAGLQQAIRAARQLLETGRRTNVFFLSDGFPNVPNSNPQTYLQEVQTLKGAEFRANVRAFGAGTGASLHHLRKIDPEAAIFETSDPLLTAFSGSTTSIINYSEPGIAGWTIRAFTDTNSNLQWDVGEASWTGVTEEDGTYTISGLPAGTYVVQEEARAGWTQTFPTPANSYVHTVTVGNNAVETVHFGNHLDAKMNLVIDSDNNNGFGAPDNSPQEESLESTQGKNVYANSGDIDSDGVIDYADFETAGALFTPLVLDLAQFADVDLEDGTVTFNYNASDPAALNGTTPAPGLMRIWRKQGHEARTTADFLKPDVAYSLESLGVTPLNLTATVWIEGVAPTQVLFDGGIRATLDVDGVGGTDLQLSDDVHVKIMQIVSGTGTIEGHFFRDRNRNRQWDHQVISGESPDIIMLLDNSRSTVSVGMAGDGIGDINGDLVTAPIYTTETEYSGTSATTILDAQIAAYILLNQSLIDLGLGNKATVSLITFGQTTSQMDLRPDLPGNQSATTPAADFNGNGVPDVVDVLTALGHTPGDSTNPQPALRRALDTLTEWGTARENANIFFLSDGYYNPMPSLGEVAEINARNINFRGFAVGSVSSAENLRELDPQASRLMSADDILVALAGLGGGNADEEGLSGWTVYVDVDQNGSLSGGDLSAVTQADGSYVINNVPAGQLTVRMVDQAGWLQTAPHIIPDNVSDESLARDHYVLSIGNDQTLSKLNFGVIEELDAPEADGILFDPEPNVGEGSPIRVTVSNPTGFTDDGLYPLLYSYDLNNDGDFIDRGESYRSISPFTSIMIGDGEAEVAAGTVRVRIHDALGKYTDIVSTTAITVDNLAPNLLLFNVPAEVDIAGLPDSAPLLRGAILDASGPDAAAPFEVEWIVRKDETIVEEYTVTVAAGVRQSYFEFIPAEGPGEYTVTFAATDKDGGRAEITRTINVVSTAPIITSAGATPTTVTSNTATLAATAIDDGGEPNLRYFWEVDRPEEVDAAALATNGTNDAKEIQVLFRASGTFTFTVYAVDDQQQYDAETIVVTVVAEPTSVVIDTDYAPVAASGTHTFGLVVLDQFGNEVTTYAGTPVWSIISGSPVGAIDPVTGEYTAGVTAGVDEIQVTLNSFTAVAHAVVSAATDYPIFGAASNYSIAEGQSIGSPTPINGQGLAGFIDSLSGTTTSDYAVTIDWDIADLEPAVPASFSAVTIGSGISAFEVYGHHQYTTPGSYTFKVTVTPDDGRDPIELTGSVSVTQAVPNGTMLQFNPQKDVEFDDLLFVFDSRNPADDASDFDAEVTWDPSVVTSSTTPGSGVRVEKFTTGPLAGYFGVYGKHTYTTLGTRTVSVKLWKNASPVYPSGQEPSQAVSVYSVDVPTPESAGTWVQSTSQLGVQWKKTASSFEAAGNRYELVGYVLWAFNETTGVRRRIPSDPNSVVNGTPTDHDPNGTLYYVDQNLPTNTNFVYTVQAMYVGPLGETYLSAMSESMSARTASNATVPTPANVIGTHGSFDDPETPSTALVKGSQLSWTAPPTPTGSTAGSSVYGFRVYRKELNEAEEWVWRDLFSLTDQTTPADDPDFRSTLVQGQDWDQPGGQNLLMRVLDPRYAPDGRLSWFDPFDFGEGETTVQYAIVGFAPTNDPVPANAIVAGEPAFITIEKDLTPPSAVTGLTARSYPQAIQLTWDDRPVADDADFGGWNVYRWTQSSSPTTDPEDWTLLTSTPILDEVGYNDYTAEVGETAHYMLVAIDQNLNASAPVFISHRRSLNGEPPPPTGLVGRSNGTDVNSLGKTLVTWDEVVPVQHLGHLGDELAGYDVERQDGAGWIRLRSAGDVDGDTTSIDDEGLALLSDFVYRVRAVDGDGDYSPWVSASAATGDGVAPAMPTLVSSDSGGFTSIELAWAVGSGGDPTVAYRVYRSIEPDSGFRIHPDYATDLPATSLDDDELSASTSYHYRIYAVDADGDLSDPLEVTEATETVTESRRPIIKITSPGLGQSPLELSADTRVRGIIDDENNNLTKWSLILRPLTPAGQLTDIVIASGTTEMGQAPAIDVELGLIQATQFANGVYRLVVQTVESDQPDYEQPIGLIRIKTDVKVGNFTLPITDLEIDTPSGRSIEVTRVYDSSKASEPGDFGYGWRLDVADTQLRTTETDSGRANGETTIRYGDIVYITIPGRGEHAFQFVPKPSGYENGSGWPLYAIDPTHIFYAGDTYTASFVSVDGSGATLEVPGFTGGLRYDRNNKTFFGMENYASFNPKSSEFGGMYLLTTADGEKYEVNAESGDLVSSEDANGNKTTYADGRISGDGQGITIHRDQYGRIDWISTDPTGQKGQTVRYEYSPYIYDGATLIGGGDLVKVIDPTGREAEFAYTDGVPLAPETFEPRHLLTTMTDPRGLDVVKVAYDRNGKVVRVDDVRNDKTSVGYGAFNGKTGSTSNTDLLGNTTEQVFNEHGDVVRTIEAIRHGNTVVKYVVTVHDFTYNSTQNNGSLRDMVLDGKTHYNRLFSQTDWQSFEVSGNDPQGVRYTARPAALGVKFARQTSYHLSEDQNDPDNGHLASETVLLTDGETYRTTHYSDYTLGRPGLIVDAHTGAQTINTYDSAGNLTSTENALGEKTFYGYSNAQESYVYKTGGAPVDLRAIPKGLLLETWVVRPDGPDVGSEEDIVVLSTNRYYGSTASARNIGRLESTTDAAGHRTYNAYDDLGRPYLTWYKATDPTHGEVRVESETVYDAAGRTAATIEGRVARVLTGQVIDAGLVTRTYYDAAGMTLVTVDAHGEQTVSSYDARGNLVRSLYPDGTETRTVYDDMGRAEWVSDRFASDSSYTFNATTGELTWSAQEEDASYMVTRNVYDSLGRLAGTERYKDVQIDLATEFAEVADGLFTTSAPDSGSLTGNRVAETFTVYDEQGRVVETVDASGLRSGSVYYPNGQLHFSGPLEDAAPDNWFTLSDPLDSFRVDATTSSKLVMTYAYEIKGTTEDPLPAGTVVYDTVTDASGLVTRTYKDVLGRTVLTTLDPNTPSDPGDDITTRVVYGVNGAAAAGVTSPELDEGWQGVPVGSQHVVKIDPRGMETHELYDRAGRLTDIWLPAVDDGSVTGNDPERPHWSYTYDERGNQLSQTDPMLRVTTFTYDVENRRTSRTLPADSDADLTNDTETFTYDSFGRAKTHTDFNGQVTAYVYDNESLTLVGGGSGDGLDLTNPRPHLGRLIEERRYEDATAFGSNTIAETTRYGYDELGRRASVGEYAGPTDATPDRVTTYAYDDVTGGVVQIGSPEGIIHHQYDLATGRLIRTWTASNETAYGYDELGRLEHVYAVMVSGVRAVTFDYFDPTTHEPVFESGTAATTRYTYTSVGALDTTTEDQNTLSASDDLIHDYDYDDFQRLVNATVKQGDGDLLFDQTYDLRIDGQRNSVTEKRYDGTSSTPFSDVTVTWTYDEAGRLASETRDEDGNATVDSGTEYADNYAFDLNGNRVRREHDAVDPLEDAVTLSEYNDRDQLEKAGVDDDADSVLDPGEVDTELKYDPNGSTISEETSSGIKKYQWDLRNRLIGFDANGNDALSDIGDATFRYDHDGVRVGKTIEKGPDPDEVIEYLQDSNNLTSYSQVLEERLNGSLVRSYRIGNDVIAQADGSTVRLFLYDGGGSVRSLVDATGQPVSTEIYAYDAFGNRIAPTNPAMPISQLLYRGELFDATLGQYVLRARYLDTITGRFTQFDSYEGNAGSAASLHKYIYANGNSIAGLDPSGLMTLSEILTTAGNIIHVAIRIMQPVAKVLRIVNTISTVVDSAKTVYRILDMVRRAYAATSGDNFAPQLLGQVASQLGITQANLGVFNTAIGGANNFLSSHWSDFRLRLESNVDNMVAEASSGLAVNFHKLLTGMNKNKDIPLIIDLPSEPGVPGVPQRPSLRLPLIDVGRTKIRIQSDGRQGRFLGLGFATKKIKGIESDVGVVRILQIDYQNFENKSVAGVKPSAYWPHYHVQPNIDEHHPMRLR